MHIVAVFAVFKLFPLGTLVGQAGAKYGVRAPATFGHELFERTFRVPMNTMEQWIWFLPALLIASVYWPNKIGAGVGVTYLVGRFLYRHLYLADPTRPGPGSLLTIILTFALLAAALAGAMTRHAA